MVLCDVMKLVGLAVDIKSTLRHTIFGEFDFPFHLYNLTKPKATADFELVCRCVWILKLKKSNQCLL